MNLSTINPKRGEIWRVQLDPIRGSEQGKTRPVIVLSQPPIGRPTVRLCAIVTNHKPEHQMMVWCATLQPDESNGLTKDSTVDTAQTRTLDLERFETKLGQISKSKLDEVKAALIAAIGGAPQ